ncbi:hypothetical protein CSC22_5225 (plasmid) [Escherichia coli]|nr:hypothetical protein CSC22_5225 [Escherichia coli]
MTVIAGYRYIKYVIDNSSPRVAPIGTPPRQLSLQQRSP